jgi:hypothetical protein
MPAKRVFDRWRWWRPDTSVTPVERDWSRRAAREVALAIAPLVVFAFVMIAMATCSP